MWDLFKNIKVEKEDFIDSYNDSESEVRQKRCLDSESSKAIIEFLANQA